MRSRDSNVATKHISRRPSDPKMIFPTAPNPMKITQLTTYRLAPRWLFLKIETDAGIIGWGEPVIEGKARSVEAAVHEFEPYLIGQDPARINDLWQGMYRGGFYRGR